MAQAAPASAPFEDPAALTRRGPRSRRRLVMDETTRAFLRMVSHELRTPLNSIIGFSEILNSEIYGPLGAPQYREYAEIIRSSGHKLLKLLNQILEIARLESGGVDLDPRHEPVDLALDDVVDTLGAEARSARLVIEWPQLMPAVTADHKALRTVLFNLLHNAITYAPLGEIRVRAVRRGGEVEIEIEDHGDGLDPADLPRLMRPFEQGENALVRKTEGAGLGLPIVSLLCKAMDGSLRFRTAAGEGLTAVVTLPAG